MLLQSSFLKNRKHLESKPAASTASVLEEVQSMAEEVVARQGNLTGSEQTFLQEFLAFVNQTLDRINDDHADWQATINSELAELALCGSNLKADADSVTELSTAMETQKQVHTDCRQNEATMATAYDTASQAYDAWYNALQAPGADFTGMSVEAVGASLQSGLDWYKAANSSFWPLSTAATSASSALASKHEECTLAQGSFESYYCSYAQAARAAKSSFNRCWDDQKPIYESEKLRILDGIQALQVEYRSLKIIECLAKALGQGGTTHGDIGACKSLEVDLSGLNLTVNDEPTKEGMMASATLVVPSSWPGNASWATEQYTGLDQLLLTNVTTCVDTSVTTTTTTVVELSADNFMSSGTVSFGSVTTIAGGGSIEGKTTLIRPIKVQADIKADISECISMTLFADDAGKNAAYCFETGGWGNKLRFFPGDNQIEVGPNDNWHTVTINAKADGNVEFLLNGEVKYTVNDDSRQTGKLRFVSGCTGMSVRNVKIDEVTTTTTTTSAATSGTSSGQGSCNEAMSGDGADYRGCQTFTVDGQTCQKWTAQSPHGHSRTPQNYPDSGLGDHNYCRNPDGEPSIWCYTTDPSVRWNICVPLP